MHVGICGLGFDFARNEMNLEMSVCVGQTMMVGTERNRVRNEGLRGGGRSDPISHLQPCPAYASLHVGAALAGGPVTSTGMPTDWTLEQWLEIDLQHETRRVKARCSFAVCGPVGVPEAESTSFAPLTVYWGPTGTPCYRSLPRLGEGPD